MAFDQEGRNRGARLPTAMVLTAKDDTNMFRHTRDIEGDTGPYRGLPPSSSRLTISRHFSKSSGFALSSVITEHALIRGRRLVFWQSLYVNRWPFFY